ncbi:MAG: hypothetical protein ACM3SV_04595 [Betaproteobacteria bacterium]
MSVLGHIGRGDKKLITAIVPAGQGEPLMARLANEPGVLAVTHHHARGVGRRRVEPGRMISDEKDVVLVLTETENADDVFALVYREGGLGEPHVGLVFMEKVLRGHPMLPFALPVENDSPA